MSELTSIDQLLDKFGLINVFYHKYGTILLQSALALTLLNCFFGYRLRKLWSCIFGILLGIGCGLAAAAYMRLSSQIVLAAAAAGGIIFMVLAFLLYRIGMFFLCIGAVIMTLFQLFPTPTFNSICGFMVFGVLIGCLSLIREHIVVSCITAICGGIVSAKLVFRLIPHLSPSLIILLAAGLSVMGLSFQLKLWAKIKSTPKRRIYKSPAPRPRPKEDGRSTVLRQQAKAGAQNGQAAPDFSKENSAYTVDLSNVRTEISKEVQNIYKEKQDLK